MFLTKHKYSTRSLVVSSQIRSTAHIGIWWKLWVEKLARDKIMSWSRMHCSQVHYWFIQTQNRSWRGCIVWWQPFQTINAFKLSVKCKFCSTLTHFHAAWSSVSSLTQRVNKCEDVGYESSRTDVRFDTELCRVYSLPSSSPYVFWGNTDWIKLILGDEEPWQKHRSSLNIYP